MRKFISLLLIFSIAGHASVCNLYTLKDEVFQRAKKFRRVTWPYQLKILKHELGGGPFHHVISDYVSAGVAKGYLDQHMVKEFFEKLKDSPHISRELKQSGLVEKMVKDFENYKSGHDLFLKEVSVSLPKKEYSSKIRSEITRNMQDLEKLKHLDARTVANLFKGIEFKDVRDVDIFFQLVLVSDQFRTSSRRYYLDNFKKVYLALRNENPSLLDTKLLKLYKRYQNIESTSSRFRVNRQGFHGDSARALEESRSFRRTKTMCRTRHLNTLGKSHKKLFKRFSYAATILATYYGYHTSGALYQEQGKSKFLVELTLSLLSMWAGAWATASDGLSNPKKLLIWYIKGYAYNYLDKEVYNAAFDESSGNPIVFEDHRLQKVIDYLTQNQEVAEIFKRIEMSEDPKGEVAKILTEHGYNEDEGEVNTEVLELVMQGISERVVYEKKHQDNKLKLGTETKDRFFYNNAYTIGGNIAAFFVFLTIYRTFCDGFTVGPTTIGGVSKPIQALGVATGILVLFRMINSKIYFSTREEYIGQ